MVFVKRNVWLGLELAFSQKGCGKFFLLAHQGDTTVATEGSSTFSLLWSSFKSLKVILYWTVFQTVFWIEVFLCVIDNIQKRCVYSEDFNWRLQFCIVDLIKLVIFAEKLSVCGVAINWYRDWENLSFSFHSSSYRALCVQHMRPDTIYPVKWETFHVKSIWLLFLHPIKQDTFIAKFPQQHPGIIYRISRVRQV